MSRIEMVDELNLLYLQAYRSKDSFTRHIVARLLSEIIRGLGASVANSSTDISLPGDLCVETTLDNKGFVEAIGLLARCAQEPSMEISFPIVRIALLHIALVVETRRVVI